MDELVVFGSYRILEELGAGSFGVVYLAQHIHTRKRLALKMAHGNTGPTLLSNEYKLYRMLQGREGIAQVHHYGTVQDREAMLMERLGSSLQDIFRAHRYHLPLATVLQLAVQMIDRIAQFHGTGHVHRDIKPENFVLGLGAKQNVVHLIDFGLAKPYWDQATVRHVPCRGGASSFVGTLRYASRNIHCGHEPSRRDDMESLGYTLVYFLRGSLPWQGLTADTRAQKIERIVEKKLALAPEALCSGLPREFGAYLSYCQGLRFSAEPDYLNLRAMFDLLYRKQCLPQNAEFHCTPPPSAITKRTKKRESQQTACRGKRVTRGGDCAIQRPEASKYVDPASTPERAIAATNMTLASPLAQICSTLLQ